MNEKMLANALQFRKNNPQAIFVIYGPTASGKTNISLKLSEFFQKQNLLPFVISADSRQIYKEMNIGTGKILPHEMQNIPHVWLNLISPNETFSVVDFQKSIDNCSFFIKWKQNPENIVPIICGGTGLYIDSIVFKRNYLGAAPNQKRRQELENFRLKYGNQELWNKLFKIDPEYAKILHPNNYTYIIRGIEVFEETGKSKLESESPKPLLKYPTFFWTPYQDTEENRKILYEKINSRIEEMFTNGLVDEVKNIIKNYNSDCPGLKTIWYKEIVSYFNNEISLQEAKSLIAQHNRNYAKRQITWNKKKYDMFLK